MGTLVVLVLVLVLSVGVAYGRYRTDLFGDVGFTNRESAEVYLWGAKSETGEYLPLPGNWTATDLAKTLAFTVTNGLPMVPEEMESAGETATEPTEPMFQERDITFTLQLAVNQGIGSTEELVLLLRVGEESIPAQAEPIREGTELYEKFGSGWVYRFLNEKGEPYRWILPGGAMSELTGELVCQNYTMISEACIMQLQVIAEDNG